MVIAVERAFEVEGGRVAVEGIILKPGHPAHDTFVGVDLGLGAIRNPVTYLPSQVRSRALLRLRM